MPNHVLTVSIKAMSRFESFSQSPLPLKKKEHMEYAVKPPISDYPNCEDV